MNNRFVILIGSYNNEQWAAQNIESVLSQTYPNFKIIYYNAVSTDKTGEIVSEYAKKDQRIVYFTSPKRQLKTWFFEQTVEQGWILDNDIVCILDGDDFLASEEVLNYLNEVYNKISCWMTYGGMIVWNGGESTQEAFPQNSLPPPEVFEKKLYRQDLWRYSHMRTCRGFLWNRMRKEDYRNKHDGKYLSMCDLPTVYSFLEMCPSNKIFRVPETIYIWNNSNESRGLVEVKENNNVGNIYEAEIRNRKKYDEISVVVPTLAGGLGNQMFEIAAAASLAKDNNSILIVNPDEHILPNQGRNVHNYVTNVFSRVVLDNNPPIKTHYGWDKIGYKPIPFQPNVKLRGHYQSFNYFDHNRDYIKSLFGPTEEVKLKIKEKYGHFDHVTAIQVRRGDYHKFPDHHPLLTKDYYKESIKLASPTEIWVFSDDTEWCREHLQFDCLTEYLKDEDYMELYIMSLCKNIIISNSSFGWWGSYLNERDDATIYVPSTWFGPALITDGFQMDDLILKEWIKV
jgi:glycosyltransferase involved in cell wall biosynthesis